MLWTTPKNSDTCTAYMSEAAPEHALFETKQECEDWVATRRCRAGFKCFDGCNYTICDPEGKDLRTTRKGCGMVIWQKIRFSPGSAVLQEPQDWDKLLESIATTFRVEERVLHVVGHTSPAEAAAPSERQQLAQDRVEAVGAALVTRGVAPQRIVLEPNARKPSSLDDKPLVSFRLEPDQPRRNDFDPDSEYYRDYCGK